MNKKNIFTWKSSRNTKETNFFMQYKNIKHNNYKWDKLVSYPTKFEFFNIYKYNTSKPKLKSQQRKTLCTLRDLEALVYKMSDIYRRNFIGVPQFDMKYLLNYDSDCKIFRIVCQKFLYIWSKFQVLEKKTNFSGKAKN